MSDKTVMSIKIDKQLKKRAQRLAKELGIPLTTVINAQLAQFVRDEKLVLAKELRPSPYLKKLIEEFEADRDKDKNMVGPFESVDEMFAHLDSQLEK